MGVPPVKIGPHPFLFLTTAPNLFCMVGMRYFSGKVMHCCRIVNGIKDKNIKNSLGAKWNASHLAVRLCALRHWKRVPMPLTTQSLRHPLTRVFHFAPRIKTARHFTAPPPDDNMIYRKEVVSNLPNDVVW